MNKIKTLLKENEPFAVVQYFEWLKSSKSEKIKKYELLTVSKNLKHINYSILSEDEIDTLKKSKEVTLVINNNDGKVYEYNDFKQYKESLNCQN